jgi:AAA15 family ATPase/GTPase
MNYFIKNIHINKLFHLENIDIPIANGKYPHLIITGKNGSGKTVLLNAIAEFLSNIKDDRGLSFLSWEKQLRVYRMNSLTATVMADKAAYQNVMASISSQIDRVFGKVDVKFGDVSRVVNKYVDGDFIIAMYRAYRKPEMVEPKNPTKPRYSKKGDVKETATNQFLNFMSDMKIQEALARNEKQFDDADEINAWFVDFEKLLQRIYQDENLKLEFNYKDYSFRICTESKRFKFTELSDGFAAVLDIVADLILKMQDDGSLTRVYEKEGIVLIDEIETHLHLELQKIIMPLLTRIFPNIQFIVTTHSPFVLNSMPDAVAYDLEHRKPIEDLSNYSYEALAEGYFGVSTESSAVEMRLNRLQELLEQEERTDAEKNEIKILITELDKVSEAVSPDLVGEYVSLKLNHVNIIKEIGI